MRYFVIAEDGNRYGPADIETLNQWAQEGRLLPTTLLEEEGSGARLAASAVAGINFPAGAAPGPAAPNTQGPFGQPAPATGANPYASGPAPGAPYQRPMYATPSNEGNTEVIFSWILGIVGILGCCCGGFVLNIIGAVLGKTAMGKGNQGGNAPMIVNIVGIVLGVIWIIYFFAVGGVGKFREGYQRGYNSAQQQQMRRQFGTTGGTGGL